MEYQRKRLWLTHTFFARVPDRALKLCVQLLTNFHRFSSVLGHPLCVINTDRLSAHCSILCKNTVDGFIPSTGRRPKNSWKPDNLFSPRWLSIDGISIVHIPLGAVGSGVEFQQFVFEEYIFFLRYKI